VLQTLLGSRSSEQVLIFLLARNEGYPTEIAEFYDADLYAIQRQLEKMESSNILVSRKVGRTRVYEFNPRYALLEELRSILEKALSYYPEEIREDLMMNRRRPRRSDKPL
jgi:predicted transcriptional regulator